MAVAAMMEEIDRFCCDEKQLVTYQWLSRKLNVASDTSKRCAAHPPSFVCNGGCATALLT